MKITTSCSPRLVVADADRAIAFYQQAFQAELIERHEGAGGTVVHAALRAFGLELSLTEADPPFNTSPADLGGSSVMFRVTTADPDALADAIVTGGGEVVIPVDDRDYGYREGRLRDPFGHLWIVSRPLAAR